MAKTVYAIDDSVRFWQNLTFEDIHSFVNHPVWKALVALAEREIKEFRSDRDEPFIDQRQSDLLLGKILVGEYLLETPEFFREKIQEEKG